MEAFEHMFDQRPGGGCLDPILHRAADRVETSIRGEVKEQAVRTYDDPVEVRRGPAAWGPAEWLDSGLGSEIEERPEQFLWRGRLWQVREVIAHWVETGAWWICKEGVVASGGRVERKAHPREVWRVAAARGRAVSAVDDPGFGVFDLAFDWSEGVWRLAGSLD